MYLNDIHTVPQYCTISIVGDVIWVYDFDFNKLLFGGFGSSDDELKITANKARQKYIFLSRDNTLYRVPRTLIVAYNETHLFSPDIRQNCAHIYAALECKDPITIIADFLFNLIIFDYSLYRCVNL